MLLMVNVDDISGELVPHAIDSLMEQGAQSVHVVSALTKKGRPEFIFFVDAPEYCVQDLARYLNSELGSLGVRIIEHGHMHVPYHMMNVLVECPDTPLPEPIVVRVKCFTGEESLTSHAKAEFDDVQAATKVLGRAGLPLTFPSLKALVEMVALSGREGALAGVAARAQED